MFFENLYKCLEAHIEKYPRMTPCDCVKLLFQSVYGCGHFVDAGKAHSRLKAELDTVKSHGGDSWEHIGNGRARLMLSAIDDCELDLVAKMFAASAVEDAVLGSRDDEFNDGLMLIVNMASDGKMPFSAEEAETYINAYLAAGGGAVSHSDTYRESYAPAYRVMSPSAVRAYCLAKEIEKRILEKGSCVIAIDGMCASGKSTVAAFLSNVFDANIIHADDFFLPPEKRTAERLAEVGGNMDRERLAEVLESAVKSDFSYRPYQCWRGVLGDELCFVNKPLLIVEGSYSLHPELQRFYDIKVLSLISADEQLERLEKRNPELVERFVNEWIPMENRYFEGMNTAENADFVI